MKKSLKITIKQCTICLIVRHKEIFMIVASSDLITVLRQYNPW
jgi:hypothetical protein